MVEGEEGKDDGAPETATAASSDSNNETERQGSQVDNNAGSGNEDEQEEEKGGKKKKRTLKEPEWDLKFIGKGFMEHMKDLIESTAKTHQLKKNWWNTEQEGWDLKGWIQKTFEARDRAKIGKYAIALYMEARKRLEDRKQRYEVGKGLSINDI